MTVTFCLCKKYDPKNGTRIFLLYKSMTQKMEHEGEYESFFVFVNCSKMENLSFRALLPGDVKMVDKRCHRRNMVYVA